VAVVVEVITTKAQAVQLLQPVVEVAVIHLLAIAQRKVQVAARFHLATTAQLVVGAGVALVDLREGLQRQVVVMELKEVDSLILSPLSNTVELVAISLMQRGV
jgi:hypothetical protein